MCVNKCVSEVCMCMWAGGGVMCVINCVSEVCWGEGNVMCVSIYVGERERDRERVRYKVFYYALVSVRVLVCASLG